MKYLPETIAVRRHFLKENGHISMIAKSAMDETWGNEGDYASVSYIWLDSSSKKYLK